MTVAVPTDAARAPSRSQAGGSGGPPGPPAAPGGPARVARFYHDVAAEMKRVTWPDRKTLTDSTVRIIVFVLLLGAVIALLDLGLQFFLVRLPAILLGR